MTTRKHEEQEFLQSSEPPELINCCYRFDAEAGVMLFYFDPGTKLWELQGTCGSGGTFSFCPFCGKKIQ